MSLSGEKTKLEKELEALFACVSREDLRLLRDWLRDCDPINDWPVEERLARVRAKVMKEVYQDEECEAENEETNSRKV